MKPHKILTYSDNCCFHFFYRLFDQVQIFKQILKVSAFYLEKQKQKNIPKKNLSCCQYQNKEALFTNPIFREGFRVEVLF